MSSIAKIEPRRSNTMPRSADPAKEGRGTTALSVFVRVASFRVVAVLDYLIAFFVATSLVPVAMASMADGLGLDPVNAPPAGFGVWLLSSLALVLFLVVLALVGMRALWRLRARAVAWAKGK